MPSPVIAVARQAPSGPPWCGGASEYSVQVLRGARAMEGIGPEVEELRQRTGQSDNPLLCLDFFLGRVQIFPRNQPVLLLVRSQGRLEGVVYLLEKTVCGVPTGYLRGFDHLTGESSVIAQEQVRASLLQIAVQQLFVQTRARVAWATVCQGATKSLTALEQVQPYLRVEASSLSREHRLKLGETFDATLSRFGPHTRRNLRYYRRRAEKDLNASFHAELGHEESQEALEHLKHGCFQPFPDSVADWWKMDALLHTRPGYFAMGLRANGQWISYLVGIRTGRMTYVLMQINHNAFSRYSLSTAMRSYFFEHEILRGQGEIKFVNGTCALFQRCCELDTCVTVSARRGLTALVIFNWIAPWYSAPDHALNMRRWTTRPVP
jgi:Acetyltransferase (GNAT) domain